MDILLYIVNGIFAASVIVMIILSGGVMWLLFKHLRLKREKLAEEKEILAKPLPAELPRVLLQIPSFNEPTVIARAIEAATRLDWPRDRFSVQVLDDSTDETTEIARQAAEKARADGLEIEVLHRTDRSGFKAGALIEGLKVDDAPFVAILDADYVPPANFIVACMTALLHDDRLAFAQARCDFLNADENAITKAQSMVLDGHLAVEQTTRCWSGWPMPFNGTCGIWRRAAIEDAGGWSADTITEDLDLSYRAYMRGWRALFLTSVPVPGELPDTFQAWRQQQFRWTKGMTEVSRRVVPRFIRSRSPLRTKLAVLFHLSQTLYFPLLVLAYVFGLIALFANKGIVWPLLILFLVWIAAGYVTSIGMAWAAHDIVRRRSTRGMIAGIATIYVIYTSIALRNAKGVLEAVAGKITPFVRTPKKGDTA